MNNYLQKLEEYTNAVNCELEELLKRESIPLDLRETVEYSVFAGGKRLRPALLLGACELLGGALEDALPFAAAMEMIHTYSLIHDDLPALDNDDYRRGRLTSHKKFGEDRAILAGDALLSYAFEVLLENCTDKSRVKAARLIAAGAGASKMVAGQWVDVTNNGLRLDFDTMEYIHLNKTAAMIIGAVTAGGALAGADDSQTEALELYGKEIGYTFQIVDDILDVTSTTEELGKAVGSDEANNKTTFVTLYGLEGAMSQAELHTQNAIKAIEQFDNNSFFKETALYLLHRKK